MKLSNRNTGNILVVTIIALFWMSWLWYANFQSNKFYHAKISAYVIESNDWWKRAIKFNFTDGNHIYINAPVDNKLCIGDSIAKQRESFNYQIYRKNGLGQYQKMGEYSY